MTCKEAAKRFVELGMSPIPIKNKKAIVEWLKYQTEPVSGDEIAEYWKNGASVGVVCGYGNLEVMDFDEDGFYERWLELLPDELKSKLVVSQTPSGCYHVYYRTTTKPQGNTALARLTNKDIAIETRGTGGYVVACPSPGYVLVRGKFNAIQTISEEDHEVLWACARSLNEYWREKAVTSNVAANRAGDDFNRTRSWDSILAGHGWVVAYSRHGNTYWTRPGKTKGASASTNDTHLYVFSSNAHPFEPATSYTKFGAYAALEFSGDFFMAAKSLGKKQREYDKSVYTVSEHTPRRLRTFDNIEEQTVDWLIEPYIPIGFTTMLFGDSGIGKSTSMYAICSALSNGYNPIEHKWCEPVKSIILSAEDPAEQVILPRLKNLGATLSNIAAPEEVSLEGDSMHMRLSADGCAELSEMVREFGAGLVVIDPLRAYFDGDNMDAQLQARAFMRRLNEMAAHLKIAVVIVHHVNKNTSVRGRYRASGSQDFFDACRSALMAGQDPNDENHYALMHEKHNLSPKGDSIGYTFDKDQSPAFRFTGSSEICSDDIVQVPTKGKVQGGKLKDCKPWLLELLETEGELDSNAIFKLGEQFEFSKATIYRAKKECGSQIKPIPIKGDGGKVVRWNWRLRQFGGGFDV